MITFYIFKELIESAADRVDLWSTYGRPGRRELTTQP